jgi:hypothetical protein
MAGLISSGLTKSQPKSNTQAVKAQTKQASKHTQEQTLNTNYMQPTRSRSQGAGGLA